MRRTRAKTADALLAALRQLLGRGTTRRRARLSQLWEAFQQAAPESAASWEARTILASSLRTLEDAGVLVPAKSRPDRTASPPLPSSVTLTPWEDAPEPALEPPPVAWAPELAFAHGLHRREQLVPLYPIQDFLAKGGRSRPLVPERERSAELYDDEKRLERLRKTALFGPGRLTLELLRCFAVSPPLVVERCPDAQGRPLLVIENHHTYDSFRRFNATRGRYSALVYGAGKAVLKSVPALAELARELDGPRAEYFGDLDATGLGIARDLTNAAADMGLAIEPAADWYALLLERGRGRRFPYEGRKGASPEELSWLPAGLRAEVAELLGAGLRLPQELVGWEVLARQ